MPKANRNSRVNIVIEVIMMLIDKPTSVQMLAKHLGVERSTAQRYMQAMHSSPLPIEKWTVSEDYVAKNPGSVFYKVIFPQLSKEVVVDAINSYQSKTDFVKSWLRKYCGREGLINMKQLARHCDVSYFALHRFSKGETDTLNGIENVYDFIRCLAQ